MLSRNSEISKVAKNAAKVETTKNWSRESLGVNSKIFALGDPAPLPLPFSGLRFPGMQPRFPPAGKLDFIFLRNIYKFLYNNILKYK